MKFIRTPFRTPVAYRPLRARPAAGRQPRYSGRW